MFCKKKSMFQVLKCTAFQAAEKALYLTCYSYNVNLILETLPQSHHQESFLDSLVLLPKAGWGASCGLLPASAGPSLPPHWAGDQCEEQQCLICPYTPRLMQNLHKAEAQWTLWNKYVFPKTSFFKLCEHLTGYQQSSTQSS